MAVLTGYDRTNAGNRSAERACYPAPTGGNGNSSPGSEVLHGVAIARNETQGDRPDGQTTTSSTRSGSSQHRSDRTLQSPLPPNSFGVCEAKEDLNAVITGASDRYADCVAMTQNFRNYNLRAIPFIGIAFC
jgi:hypothetical protein